MDNTNNYFVIPEHSKGDIVIVQVSDKERKPGKVLAVSVRTGKEPEVYYAISLLDGSNGPKQYKLYKQDKLFKSSCKLPTPMYEIGDEVMAYVTFGDGTKQVCVFEIKSVTVSLELNESTGEVMEVIKYFEDPLDHQAFWCFEHEVVELEPKDNAKTA